MADPNHQLFNNTLLLTRLSWEVNGDGSVPNFLTIERKHRTHLIDSGSQKSYLYDKTVYYYDDDIITQIIFKKYYYLLTNFIHIQIGY